MGTERDESRSEAAVRLASFGGSGVLTHQLGDAPEIRPELSRWQMDIALPERILQIWTLKEWSICRYGITEAFNSYIFGLNLSKHALCLQQPNV